MSFLLIVLYIYIYICYLFILISPCMVHMTVKWNSILKKILQWNMDTLASDCMCVYIYMGVCVCVCWYFCNLFLLYYLSGSLALWVGFNPWLSHTKDLKMVLDTSLTLIIIRYVSRVKWRNPREGGVSSLTPRCSSYWKGSLWVALDYGCQFYLQLLPIFTYFALFFFLWFYLFIKKIYQIQILFFFVCLIVNLEFNTFLFFFFFCLFIKFIFHSFLHWLQFDFLN